MNMPRLLWILGCLTVALLGVVACVAPGMPDAAEPMADAEPEMVEIEYWQYNFEARVLAMDRLIEMFEAANPNIKVVHNADVPYAEYRDKIAASVPAGVGPDVATLFYGWQTVWLDADYLVPLPEDAFPKAMIDDEFSPLVQASFVDGTLYTIPTAVRALAMFYNKDLMAAAGLDPESPPTTLDELASQAAACTVRADNGDYEVQGFVVDLAAQDHHWFREVLVRQFGGEPFSADGQSVIWNSEAGQQAWNYLLKFKTELETGDRDLFDGSTSAFLAGRACFHIDGSFRLGTIANNAPDLNFGVVELPSHNGVQSTFGSYWTHGITQKGASDPARLDAAVKFLQFVTSDEAGSIWVDMVGELPARLNAGSDPELLADPKLGAFAAGLAYAQATFFVNEPDQRQALVDAYDMVVLSGEDPNAALDIAAETVQDILDGHYGQ